MGLLLRLFSSEAKVSQRLFLQYQRALSARFICDELAVGKKKFLQKWNSVPDRSQHFCFTAKMPASLLYYELTQ